MQAPLKILIADDDPQLLEALSKTATQAGYEVVSTSDGASALSRARESRFDLLVTDLQMPYMDGQKLMEELASLPHDPPKVIAITAYATLDAAVSCLRRGASDFLTKPFEMAEFLSTVKRVSSKKDLPETVMDWEELGSQYSLTKRQVDVLRAFYLTGKTNSELAEDLFISEHTVKSHLKAGFEKLGAASRAELLRKLREFSQK